MEIKVAKIADIRNRLRRLGYAEIRDSKSGKISYVRRLSRDYYPRFHIYLKREDQQNTFLAIHLDQKQPSYKDQTAHSGEYDSDLVLEEAKRVKIGIET